MAFLDLDSDEMEWTDVVLPQGGYDHARSLLPESVGLRLGGVLVALADPFDLHLVNDYCSVRERDLDLLRDLLARGGNPDAGWHVVDEALRSVSVDRNTTAVFEAIVSEDPALLELLLQKGARLDSPWSSTTPLQFARMNHRAEAEALLLRYGAT